ncbi:MAG: efflux RND transporter periplasmic adaptor subunit [Comamonadaceae bacterium]|nr:efflux RND transporter periplasmic adaptor subunit [Comamonadaceae bacterium]
MTWAWPQRRSLGLWAVLLALGALLGYVALRAGPLAPVAVTEVEVRHLALRPALYGVGTVQARQSFRIGPTLAGRVLQLHVDVGDSVRAGQVLGSMDPVDLQARIRAQQAAVQRVQASVREAQARRAFAATQAQRYAQLWAARATSEELHATRQQELAVADAALAAAHEEQQRLQAELMALQAQHGHLRLVAPQDGIVTAREAEPGSTVVAGQAVLEVVPPESLWIQLRLDQVSAQGLTPGLAAHIALRSRPGAPLAGRVLRVEPKADAVTEELLAKVAFTRPPQPLPPLGELAEVTLDLAPLPPGAVIPAAAVQRQGGQRGVWQRAEDGRLRFLPITTGRADLDGQVQVLQGLEAGARIVVYSDKPLHAGSRTHVVAQLQPGTP